MKIAVINFSGNVGKSTVARHLLLPRIEAAEQRLIEGYAPACNSTHIVPGKQPAGASCGQVGSLLEAALRGR